MLEIAICDDESNIRSQLKKIIMIELQLKGLPYQLTEKISGEELIEATHNTHFDIIFLDVEMSGINGIETAKLIRERHQDTVIIFVTAHPDFVFQGYEVRALNYLLKPYDEEKIKTVLTQGISEINGQRDHYLQIVQREGDYRLSLTETSYFYSDKRQVVAVTKNETYSFYGKLSELEEQIPDFFIRIHNRYLVNLNYVTTLGATAVHCGEVVLPVSRQYKQKVGIAFSRMVLK